MSNRSQVESAVSQFFEAMISNDASKLPLSEHVEYLGVLTPEPIRGETDVRAHVQETAPFMQSITQGKIVIEGDSCAVVSAFEAVNGVHIEGAYFLEVTDGNISLIRSVFDSRPLFSGGKSE